MEVNMKRAAVLLAATVFLMLVAPAALAHHKPDHARGRSYPPPGCKNPGPAQRNPNCQPASFTSPFQARDGSITIGMLIIAGLGAFTVMLAARGVRRRVISRV